MSGAAGQLKAQCSLHNLSTLLLNWFGTAGAATPHSSPASRCPAAGGERTFAGPEPGTPFPAPRVEGEGQHQWIGHEVEGGPIPLGQLPTLTEEIETVQNLRHHVVSRPHELPPTQVHLLVNPVPQPPPARSLQLQ
eukprot:CAMPEP_0173327750 /NCGR_PEP_ID=MMETSP1144-20121109/1777_1 /TAXON_ID=483371 /ORGANISM="non described non described, Strain CCMP2298" /LENGTH=135 /DNA_ID=CAMNT_0014272171 /DNA_START=189 /DNA_END=597 /DNA_ORIENTATION=+